MARRRRAISQSSSSWSRSSMSESSENDKSDRSRCSPEFILGGASGGDGLARWGAEGREDGWNWFLAVAAGEAVAGTVELVGRGGGRSRELAARA
jgi:hypothetical protein